MNKHGYFFGLLLCVWLVWLQPVAATPDIQHWQTKAGTPVFYLKTEGLPLIDIGLVFDAGSARDGDQPGLASFTSGMLDQGAGGASADVIAQGLEGVGAQLSTSVSRDSVSISLRSLTDPDVLQPALRILQDVAARPDFPRADVERRRQQILLGIRSRGESPATLAQLAFFKQIYGDHPYANAISGYEESVKAITVDDLKAFHQSHYTARNAVLVIVGDIPRAQAEQIAEQLVSGLTAGQPAAPLPPVEMPQQAQSASIEFPSGQTHILSGVPGITHTDPDYFPLLVGNHILGGSGFTSRIVQEIREERGLSYSAYSYFSPMTEAGPFMMGLQTRNEKAGEALSALHTELETFVREGPTDEELDAAKKNITGGFALRLDSNKKLFGQIASIAFHRLPLDYLDHYIDRVNAVTREQVRDAFQRRIPLDKLATVQVGQASPPK